MQDSVNKDRDKYIGGSDIPIIMSLSPYKSRYDLLLEKAGYKEDIFKGNIYTEYGNTMEPKIRDYINETIIEQGYKPFIEGKHVREAQEGETIGIRLHTDGERETEVLEIKTTSKLADNIEDYKLYLVQLLFYMVNTGKSYGRLAVYERPEDLNETFDPARLQIWAVELNEYLDLVADMTKAIGYFIEDLQVVKANPFISEAELVPREVPDIVDTIAALTENRDKISEEIRYLKECLYQVLFTMSRNKIETPKGYIVKIVGLDVEIVNPEGEVL